MANEKRIVFPKDYEEFKKQVIENIENSRIEVAYYEVMSILTYPCNINEETFIDAMGLFEKITRIMAGDEFGDLVKNVITDINDEKALYDLGYQLYEQKVFGVAATLLKRANEIKPQDYDIVTELSVTLETLMMNEEACKILSEAPDLLMENLFCRYLLGFNKLMVGNIDEATTIFNTIKDNEEENNQHLVKALEGMLVRALLIRKHRNLDDKDLRGWHLVLNGSILLHFSPFGIDAMKGRYAFVNDSYALCRDGIERIGIVLENLNINIPNVIALPDKSSQILGLATSKMLNKPFKVWNEVHKQTEGLIVVYDLDEVYSGELLTEIADHRPGQLLWAHASNWVDTFPFSPDITTYFYQKNISPWGGGGLGYNLEEKRVETTKSEDLDIEELALKIINAERDKEYLIDEDDLISLIKPLKSLSEQSQSGILRTSGRRYQQRNGSAVKSNRFL